MRNVAAATVLAVVAALLLAAALAVSTAREVATLGLLVGRTTVAVTALPVDSPKVERIRTITGAAADADVSVSLVVPDRHGDQDRWRAFTFRGTPQAQGLGTELVVTPIGDGADLDLQGTLAIDGDGRSVDDFLAQLRTAGYDVADTTPDPRSALLFALSEPATGALATAAALGLVIALVAEAGRRTPRQVLRLRSGWTGARVAWTEAGEIGRIVVPVVSASVLVVTAIVLWSGSGAAARSFAVTAAGAWSMVTGIAILAVHVVCALVTIRTGRRGVRPSWAPVVVGVAASALVATVVVDVHAVVQGRAAAQALERTLVAESQHGDDVVLGLGPTALTQDVQLGRIGLQQLEQGTASMAQSSFMDRFTLVGDATATLPAVLDGTPAPHDQPVLLVPDALAAVADQAVESAAADLAVGWQVEERTPPRQVEIVLRRVPSTAVVTEAVLDWTNGIEPALPSWPEIPVLVVPDPSDIAPNQIGTAVANGEVRFADRAALDRALTDAGLTDAVLQVNRVGVGVERQISAVRAERATQTTAASVAGLAIVLAGVVLVGEHRTRTQRSARVRFLVGRHPFVQHRAFTAITSTVVAVVAGMAELAVDGSAARAIGVASVGAVVVGTLLATILGAGALRRADRWRKTW